MIPGVTKLPQEPVAALPAAMRTSTPNQFAALLSDPDAELIILLIAAPFSTGVNHKIGALPAMVAVLPIAGNHEYTIQGGETAVYLSDKGYITNAADSIKHQHFPGRLNPALSRSISLFDGAEPTGAGTFSAGDIIINNDDGGMDHLLDYAWDGRDLKLIAGAPDFDLNQFGTVLKATVSSINCDDSQVMLRITDPSAFLQQPLLRSRYAGTGGAEGASDLENVSRPYVAGRVRNITPVLVDSSDLLYQVHDGKVNAVDGVRDKGVALSGVGDYSTSTLLLAASTGLAGSGADIEAGEYATCLNEGLFRLGGQPDGLITADVEGDAAPSYVSATGAIAKRIVSSRLGAFSLQTSQIDAGSINALDIDQSATVGIFVNEEVAAAEVISALLQGVGGYWYFNRVGEFSVGRLEIPAAPVITLTIDEIHTIYRMDMPVPVWRRRVGYRRSWTVQNADDMAGAVTDADRQLYGNDYRYAVSEDSAVGGRHRFARDVETPGYFDLEADAEAEADRLNLLHGPDRDRYQVQLKRALFRINPGQTVRVVYPRYNLTAGKDFFVAAMEEETESGFTTLEVWG